MVEIENKINAQWEQLQQDVPNLFPELKNYQQFMGQTYGRKDAEGRFLRFFHSEEHCLEIGNQNSAWEQQQYKNLQKALSLSDEEVEYAKKINRIAAPAHDTEYHTNPKSIKKK